MKYTGLVRRFLKPNYPGTLAAMSGLSLVLALASVLAVNRMAETAKAASVDLASANLRVRTLSEYARTGERDKAALAAELASAREQIVQLDADLAGFAQSWRDGQARLTGLAAQLDGERAAREAAEKKLRRRTAAAAKPSVSTAQPARP